MRYEPKKGLFIGLLQKLGKPFNETIGLQSEEDPEQETRDFQLENILNEGIEFGDNIRGGFFEIVTNGLRQKLIHNLGYTPTGFLVVSREGEGSVWSEDLTEWTKDVLFFGSSVPSQTVRIFVL